MFKRIFAALVVLTVVSFSAAAEVMYLDVDTISDMETLFRSTSPVVRSGLKKISVGFAARDLHETSTELLNYGTFFSEHSRPLRVQTTNEDNGNYCAAFRVEAFDGSSAWIIFQFQNTVFKIYGAD